VPRHRQPQQRQPRVPLHPQSPPNCHNGHLAQLQRWPAARRVSWVHIPSCANQCGRRPPCRLTPPRHATSSRVPPFVNGGGGVRIVSRSLPTDRTGVHAPSVVTRHRVDPVTAAASATGSPTHLRTLTQAPRTHAHPLCQVARLRHHGRLAVPIGHGDPTSYGLWAARTCVNPPPLPSSCSGSQRRRRPFPCDYRRRHRGLPLCQ